MVLNTFRERPGKFTKGVPFHKDNAPAHKSVGAMVTVRDMTVPVNWLITLHIL